MVNPLAEKTYNDLYQYWAGVINAPGKNLISIWYPIGGAHLRVRQFLADTVLQKTLFTSSQQKLLLIDFQESETIHPTDFEERIGFELHKLSTDPFFFEEWLYDNKEPVALFILGLDTSLKKGNMHIFTYLNKLANLHSHLSLLIFTELNLKEDSLFANLNLGTPLFENISYQSLYSEEDGLQFYRYLEHKWQFTINPSLPPQLISHIGGHYLLLKEAGRILFSNPDTTFLLLHL